MINTFHKKAFPPLLSLFIGGVFLLVSLSSYSGPTYLLDEIGYLDNAAFIAGNRLDGASSYHMGYSVFLTPAFLIFSDPLSVWKGALVINAILWAGSFYLLNIFLQKISANVSLKKRLLVILVCAFYPAWMTMSGYAFPTPAFVFVYMLTIIFLLKWNQNRSWSIIPHSLSVGFLFWIHPTGVVVAISSIIAVGLIGFKKKTYASMIINLLIISVLILVYKKRIQPLFINSMTPEGYKPRLHYPSIFVFIKNFIDFSFLINQFVFKFIGRIAYLIVGSFSIAFFGFADTVKKVYKDLKKQKSRLLIKRMTVFVYTSLSLLGTVVIIGRGDGRRIDYWIYGRYVEPVLLPILASGFLSLWRPTYWKSKYLVFLSGLVLTSGISLEIIAIRIAFNNLINIPAFWPLIIANRGSFFLDWMTIGALGILILYLIRKVNLHLIFPFLMIIWIASSIIIQRNWHRNMFANYSAPSSIVGMIRSNFPKGSCIGFDPKVPNSPYHKERYNLYSFYFFDYRYRRMTPKEWKNQCDGPLLTFNPEVFKNDADVNIVTREVKSNLFIVVKNNKNINIP